MLSTLSCLPCPSMTILGHQWPLVLQLSLATRLMTLDKPVLMRSFPPGDPVVQGGICRKPNMPTFQVFSSKISKLFALSFSFILLTNLEGKHYTWWLILTYFKLYIIMINIGLEATRRINSQLAVPCCLHACWRRAHRFEPQMCLPHEHGPLLYCPRQSKCGLPRKGTEGPSVFSD